MTIFYFRHHFCYACNLSRKSILDNTFMTKSDIITNLPWRRCRCRTCSQSPDSWDPPEFHNFRHAIHQCSGNLQRCRKRVYFLVQSRVYGIKTNYNLKSDGQNKITHTKKTDGFSNNVSNMPKTHRRTHRYHRCDTWFLTSDSAVDYSPVPANQCHSDTCSHFRLRGSRTCRARYSPDRSSGRLKHKDKNAVFFFRVRTLNGYDVEKHQVAAKLSIES